MKKITKTTSKVKSKTRGRKRVATKSRMLERFPIGEDGKVISKFANSTSFQKGNRFWERRATLGREKTFSSPQHLWESACEYFLSEINNPNYEIQFKGKDNEQVEIPHIPAFTKEGLCLFLDVSMSYLRTFKTEHKDEPEYLAVLQRIDNTIFKQQFVGGQSGFYNQSLTARYLGLVERVDTTSKGEALQAPEIKVYNSGSPFVNDETDEQKGDKNGDN